LKSKHNWPLSPIKPFSEHFTAEKVVNVLSKYLLISNSILMSQQNKVFFSWQNKRNQNQ
jgi:hypothetical protein